MPSLKPKVDVVLRGMEENLQSAYTHTHTQSLHNFRHHNCVYTRPVDESNEETNWKMENGPNEEDENGKPENTLVWTIAHNTANHIKGSVREEKCSKRKRLH